MLSIQNINKTIKDKNIVLNKSVKDIPSQFIKIRNPGSSEHPIFTNEKCVWSNVNSDKSVSYIIPVDLYNKSEIPEELLDKRKSTLEDVFIYYFSQVKSSEDNNENAA